MKINIFKLDATAEISEICCELFDADLTVCASDDKQLKVFYPESKNVSVAVGENRLIINQSRRTFAISKQSVKVCVPAHVVPDIRLLGKRSTVCFTGGIYGDLTVNGISGKLELSSCAFASVEAICGDMYAHISETTIKGNLFLQFDKGELLAENSFVLRADCHLKNGNMGLINFSGKDLAFETAKGNITLTLAGTEDEYNTAIRVKSGTSNREGTQNEGAQKSVKALTDKGNVMLDFVGERVEITEAAAADSQEKTDERQTEDIAEEKKL